MPIKAFNKLLAGVICKNLNKQKQDVILHPAGQHQLKIVCLHCAVEQQDNALIENNYVLQSGETSGNFNKQIIDLIVVLILRVILITFSQKVLRKYQFGLQYFNSQRMEYAA